LLSTAAGVAFSLRPVASHDEPQLRAIDADRCKADLELAAIADAQRAMLIDLQYRARAGAYAAEFPDARHWAVLVGGATVGRLMEAPRPAAHHVVDIVLATGLRGRGIGTALMSEIQSEAAVAGVPVDLAASAADDRVIRWYRRLGFEIVSSDEVYVRMRWRA
jgi:ribosomal protein S18 acetylase RimI-like enzyme